MLNRRSVLATGALAAIPLAAPVGALAQNRKDAVVLAMTLEPPGLDPTAGAASAIAEIVQYNILKRSPRSTRRLGLAPAGRELGSLARPQDLHLQAAQGRQVPERRALQRRCGQVLLRPCWRRESTNKDKRTFANLTTQVVDEHTLVVLNKDIDPDLLFALGQATAIIVEPKSADTNATKPVGTGPLAGRWNKGFLGGDGWMVSGQQAPSNAAPPSASSATLLAASRRPAGGRRGPVPRVTPRAACRSSRPTRAFRCWSGSARQDHPGHQQRQKATGRCACAAPSQPPSTARP